MQNDFIEHIRLIQGCCLRESERSTKTIEKYSNNNEVVFFSEESMSGTFIAFTG